MKRIITVVALMCTFIFAEAQTAKKYVFLEHFTNTYCGNCSARNPAFYNTISGFDGLVHHLAVHPKVPYTQCTLYQANTADNEARRVHHNVFGTPKVFLNGFVTQSNPLIRDIQLRTEEGQTTSLGLQISANSGNTSQTGTIEIFTTGDVPAGGLKLYIAAVEKLVNFNAPNGEKEHHDVLRKFISSNTGDVFTPAATGESVSISYSFDFENNWMADEMYVLAWVEEADSKAVLNSGSQFDPPVNVNTNTTEIFTLPVTIQPNPASDVLRVNFNTSISGQVSIRNLSGQELFREEIEQNTSFKTLNINELDAGVYLLRVDSEKGSGVLKFVKE